MTCQEFVELVTAYLEGTLSVPERVAFEEHMGECSGCDRYLVQFRKTIDLLGELPEETLSTEGRRQLLAAFADWHRRSGPETP
jgi:anti-sigma factor RsiW